MGSKLGRTRGEQTRHREHFWDLNPSHKYQSFSLFRYTIILYYNIYKKYHVSIYAMYKIDSAMTIFWRFLSDWINCSGYWLIDILVFYFAQAQICFISWESNNARVSCCLSAASWWWPLAGPGGARPCGLAVLSRPGLPGARLTELVAIDQVTHKHTSSLWTASISAKKQVRLRRKSFMAFHKTTKWQSDHPWADYWWTTVRNFMLQSM